MGKLSIRKQEMTYFALYYNIQYSPHLLLRKCLEDIQKSNSSSPTPTDF